MTLHGTGIHPGGITERFPLTLSALCTNIRHVKAEEFSDIRNYQAEGVVRDIMLFGKPLEEAAKSPMLDILGSGFGQSVRMVGDALGLSLDDELQTGHDMAVATKDVRPYHVYVGIPAKSVRVKPNAPEPATILRASDQRVPR